ncbi:MAG TPA: TerC family protein [Bacteroidia bacterium]|nr:TerC family protein [Bacteroidia bacterium]
MNFSDMLANLFTIQGLVSLLTLSLLEIVLGVDNIIFIAITADKLPAGQRGQARTTGLVLAVFIRIALLFTLSFLSSQEAPLFNIAGHGITLRDLIFFGGGVFLLYKTGGEIREKINGEETEHKTNSKKVSVANIVFQIILIDIVFSFDSILTAIVVSKNLIIMGSAVVIAMAVMVLFSGVVADFINKNPRIKMLALTFLLVIALLLLADSIKTFTGFEIEKSYVYAALGFSLVVELLNMWEEKKRKN